MKYVIIILSFILAFIFYSKYQFRQLMGDAKAGARWHLYGWFMRFILIFGIGWIAWPDWKPVFLGAALSFPAFDIGINLWAIGQGIFYIGNTSWWDRKAGHIKWAVYLVLIILAITFNVVPWNAEG